MYGDTHGESPDPSRAGSLSEFVELLGQLRVWAGAPSYRTLAKDVGPLLRPPQIVAHSTIAYAFQAERRRVSLDLVLAIIRALGLDEPAVARWRAAWMAVHTEVKASGQVGVLRQLPVDLATFTGRESELERLIAAATPQGAAGPSSVVILAIEGMAGIGKTQLAVHAAHELVRAGRFADAQLYANLRGFDADLPPVEPASVLEAFLRQLGVPGPQIPDSADERSAMFRDRIAGKEAIVLLDNAASEDQVRDLIPSAPGCVVLITSRRSLAGLDNAGLHLLDVFSPQEAVDLLGRIAGPERVAAEPEAVGDVVGACGNLPLAIALAAARLRSRPAWTVADLAGRLRGGRLDEWSAGQRSLKAVFDLSYQGLGARHQRLIRLLSLAPGPDIDTYGAAALSETDPDRCEQLLQDLVDQHLLTEPSAGRYRMHDLIHTYAHTQAMTEDSEPDRADAVDRLLHFYAYTAQAASQSTSRLPRPEPGGPGEPVPAYMPDVRDPDSAREWLRIEYPDLDAAFNHACAHGLDGHIVALAAGLANILHTDGPWTHALDLHRTAAEAAERLSRPAARANALTDLGRLRYLTGDLAEAGRALTEALGVYDAIGDLLGQANALTDLGRVRSLIGDYPGAAAALTRALATFRTIGNRLGEAHALIDLGRARYPTGHLLEADEALTQALKTYREIRHRIGEAHALTELGRVRHQIGDYSGADDAHSRALEIYQENGQRLGEAIALTELGRVRHQIGDYPGADEALTRGLQIFRAAGSRGNEASALNRYAAVVAATGDRPRALALYHQALAMNRELNHPDDEAISLEGIADHQFAAGETAQGAEHLCEALRIYQRLGMSADAERVQSRLANLARR